MWFNSALVETTIEIDATPERVRKVFLDFDNLPKWNNRMLYTTVIHRDSTKIAGIDGKSGDSVTVTGVSGEGHAHLETNTPTLFAYSRGKFGITALHSFEFTALDDGNGGATRTLFRQFETMSGGPSFLLMSYSPLHLWIRGLFQSFDSDLKRVVEHGL